MVQHGQRRSGIRALAVSCIQAAGASIGAWWRSRASGIVSATRNADHDGHQVHHREHRPHLGALGYARLPSGGRAGYGV